MKKILFLSFFILSSQIVFGAIPPDSTKYTRQLGLKIHQGFIIIHSRNLRPIRNSYPKGLELDLAWHNTSQKAWESCHCYPKLGLALTFWNYDHPEILGYGVTSLFYVESVFAATNKISFSIRAGMGLSYQTKPYDPISNPDNYSYSTYIAFPLQLGTSLHYRFKPQWQADFTAVYNHFSNGGIKLPNKGINWPTAAVGISHYLDAPDFKKREKKDWRIKNKPQTRLDATLFLAYKEPESKLFLFFPGAELKASRQIGRLSAITFGAEYIYDTGARHEIEKAGRNEDFQKASVALGHEFLLGKFLFAQQFGFYLYKPYRVGDDVYQRYGLMFRASKHFSFGISLKAHRHVADFLDFRIGYSFEGSTKSQISNHK